MADLIKSVESILLQNQETRVGKKYFKKYQGQNDEEKKERVLF